MEWLWLDEALDWSGVLQDRDFLLTSIGSNVDSVFVQYVFSNSTVGLDPVESSVDGRLTSQSCPEVSWQISSWTDGVGQVNDELVFVKTGF